MTKLQKDLLFEIREYIKYIPADDIKEILENVVSYKFVKSTSYTLSHYKICLKNRQVFEIIFNDNKTYKFAWMNSSDRLHRENKPALTNSYSKRKEYWENGRKIKIKITQD